jgi:RNA polymerase sigma factor (sigma-70 family)
MTITALSDAELLDQARNGDEAAFTELYVRHQPAALRLARSYRRLGDPDDLVNGAFERVLGALRRGAGPTESFRAYLFVTLRRLAAELGERPADEPLDEVPEPITAAAGAAELERADRELISEAFESLPDRWQAVLWHTAVEGRKPAELAGVLGVSANAAAAMTYRAREKLRQAYLQAHLLASPAPDHEPYRSQLGAYVRDGLSKRDQAAVKRHLDKCPSCTTLVAELDDVNRMLARAVLPLFLLAGGGKLAAGAALGGAAAAGGASSGPGKGLFGKVRQMAPSVGNAAAIAVVVAGVAGMGTLASRQDAGPVDSAADAADIGPTGPVIDGGGTDGRGGDDDSLFGDRDFAVGDAADPLGEELDDMLDFDRPPIRRPFSRTNFSSGDSFRRPFTPTARTTPPAASPGPSGPAPSGPDPRPSPPSGQPQPPPPAPPSPAPAPALEVSASAWTPNPDGTTGTLRLQLGLAGAGARSAIEATAAQATGGVALTLDVKLDGGAQFGPTQPAGCTATGANLTCAITPPASGRPWPAFDLAVTLAGDEVTATARVLRDGQVGDGDLTLADFPLERYASKLTLDAPVWSPIGGGALPGGLATFGVTNSGGHTVESATVTITATDDSAFVPGDIDPAAALAALRRRLEDEGWGPEAADAYQQALAAPLPAGCSPEGWSGPVDWASALTEDGLPHTVACTVGPIAPGATVSLGDLLVLGYPGFYDGDGRPEPGTVSATLRVNGTDLGTSAPIAVPVVRP